MSYKTDLSLKIILARKSEARRGEGSVERKEY